MNNLKNFDNFLNESNEGIKEPIEEPFRDIVGIVITLFFDHTKNKNNDKPLWIEIKDIAEKNGCDLQDYCVTDSVCEFVFQPNFDGAYQKMYQSSYTGKIKEYVENAVKNMYDEVGKLKSNFTNYDVYFNEWGE